MPLIRFPTVKGLVYTIDLSKIADRANPRTVEAPIQDNGTYPEPITIDWGDGMVEQKTSGQFPTHEYSAVGVYTVTIRSVTGNLPRISLNKGQNTSDSTNATFAVTSLDHFGGQISNSSRQVFNYLFYNARNMTYCDPRIVGQPGNADLYKIFYGATSLTQPIDSFCLNFCVLNNIYTFDAAFRGTRVYGQIPPNFFAGQEYAERFAQMFYGCSLLTGAIPEGLLDDCESATILSAMFYGCEGLTSIPESLFDKCISATIFTGTFQNCHGITSIPDGLLDNNSATTNVADMFRRCLYLGGSPYVFWKADGTIDTDKFPNLTAENATNCYTDCPGQLRAQVPEAYGGTMTVS